MPYSSAQYQPWELQLCHGKAASPTAPRHDGRGTGLSSPAHAARYWVSVSSLLPKAWRQKICSGIPDTIMLPRRKPINVIFGLFKMLG